MSLPKAQKQIVTHVATHEIASGSLEKTASRLDIDPKLGRRSLNMGQRIALFGASVVPGAIVVVGLEVINQPEMVAADCVYDPVTKTDVCTTPSTITPTPTTQRPSPPSSSQPPTPTSQQPSPSTPTQEPGSPATQPWGMLDDDFDRLVNGYDPDPYNPDLDGDGELDGAELNDTDGDGAQDLFESSILDSDGDGVVDELDTVNADACIPSKSAKGCDFDEDGLDGPTDGNTEVAFEDIDGDGLDDTAPAKKGGDDDLTDGPLGDLDEDGVTNEDDKQNKKLGVGETVDEFGVIVVVPEETVPVTDPTKDTLGQNEKPMDRTSAEVNSNSTESSNGMLIFVGTLGTLAVISGGGVAWTKTRRQTE
jgi:hypothetical protein